MCLLSLKMLFIKDVVTRQNNSRIDGLAKKMRNRLALIQLLFLNKEKSEMS